MPTLNPTPEEMSQRIVRAKTIQPKKKRFDADAGIPARALELIAADSIYLYMAPEDGVGATSRNPGIVGYPGLTVNVAKCPPGDGPELHAHGRTLETFMCLRGRFEVRWGDHGQHSTHLDEHDMISVPANVMRAFRNTGTEDALLLVLIQGENRDLAADVRYAPATGEKLEQEFGPQVRERIEGMGWRFDAELALTEGATQIAKPAGASA
jgi:mannose-6-phosphate isomerase-like protein (cupin superfamily)